MAHKRHVSKDSVTSVNMAFISRQRIDPKTEQELRAACALILQNFKPSDHDIPDADPKLDFRGPHTRRREHRTDASQVKVHRPTGAPQEFKTHYDSRHHEPHRATSASKSYPDLPMRANTGKRRVESTERSEADVEHRRPVKSYTTEAPRQHFTRTDTADTDDVLSVGTPYTASTGTHQYSYSTAPTSVAATHRSSKRTSRQGDGPAAIADAQAAEWMRQELEKRRHQIASNPHSSRPQTADRPPSRAASIRSGIKEYIFPGSRNLSRSQSRSSLRSEASQAHSSSSQGWRSWGLNRKSSSRRSSRPGTSNGRKDAAELDKKTGELNLNRELPPLPSLDTWKEPQKPKEQKQKTHAPGPHIATMMRPVDHQQQGYAAAARQHHRKSGSDVRYVNTHAAAPPPRIKSPTLQAFARKATSTDDDRHRDLTHMVSAMSASSPSSHHDADPDRPPRQDSLPTSSSRLSADARLFAPNFSRKISSDGQPFDATEFAYPHVVHISANGGNQTPKNGGAPEHKSKLKKVLSAWVLKKDKKGGGEGAGGTGTGAGAGDWMGRLEREGVKKGVLVQERAAGAPVVRY